MEWSIIQLKDVLQNLNVVHQDICRIRGWDLEYGSHTVVIRHYFRSYQSHISVTFQLSQVMFQLFSIERLL
jgi:hypothetical protein